MEWTADEYGQQTAHLGPFMLEVGVDDEFRPHTYWASVIAEIHPATLMEPSDWDSISDEGGFLTMDDAKAWVAAEAQRFSDMEDQNNERLIADLEAAEAAWEAWMERTNNEGEMTETDYFLSDLAYDAARERGF